MDDRQEEDPVPALYCSHEQRLGEGNPRSRAEVAAERQAEFARAVELMEEQDEGDTRLIEEPAAKMLR